MKLQPFNRSILVEVPSPKEDKPSDSFVLVPDGVGQQPFTVVKVLSVSANGSKLIQNSDFIVVHTAMIDSIDIDGNTFNVVPETAVVAKVLDPV